MVEANLPRRFVSIRLTNSSGRDRRLVLEPWGEEYIFPHHAQLDVVAEGPPTGSLEFDYADDRITVFGWSGSLISLFLNGVELGAADEKRPIVPPTPRAS